MNTCDLVPALRILRSPLVQTIIQNVVAHLLFASSLSQSALCFLLNHEKKVFVQIEDDIVNYGTISLKLLVSLKSRSTCNYWHLEICSSFVM